MENNRHILVANISMATFLQVIKTYLSAHAQKSSRIEINDFTNLGEETLNKHIWKCYLPSSKMGKNGEINTTEATSLLKNVKHIDDLNLLDFYKSMPLFKLENIHVTIIFCNYIDDKVTEQLKNILFIKNHFKANTNNGSIDTISLEESFEKLFTKKRSREKVPKNITKYINKLGEFPLAGFLGINTRTLKSFQGGKK